MTSSANISCWDGAFSTWAIASAAGIAAVAALGLWGRYSSRTTSPGIFLVVFLGFTLGVAGVLSWQKQHRESIRAENLAALKAFDAEAKGLLDEGLTVDNADDYTAYRARSDGFTARLERWAADNMGPRASEILRRHDPKDVNIAFQSTMDQDHASAITAIIQTRENIGALIHAGASDKCVKPTTAEHPMPPNLE